MNDVLEVIKEPKKLKKTKKPIESIKEEMVEILDTNLEKVNTIDLAEEISDMVRERSKPEGKWRNTNKDFKEIEKKDLPKKSTAIEKSKGLKIAIEELQGLTKFRKKGKYGVQDAQGNEVVPPKFDKIDLIEDIDYGIVFVACTSGLKIDVFKYTKPIDPTHN